MSAQSKIGENRSAKSLRVIGLSAMRAGRAAPAFVAVWNRRRLRRTGARFQWALTWAAIAGMILSGTPLSAAEFYWDSDGDATGNAVDGTNLGNTTGAFVWDLSTAAWWNGVAPDGLWPNTFSDTAIFTGTSGVVTLGEPIQAGGLTFQTTGYTLTGINTNTLTLGASTGSPSPIINVTAFAHATIESLLAGVSGFTKSGDGTLFLTNNANSYTGDTVINGGALVITNEGQLGTSTNTISINGAAQTGNPGYSGGQLVVDGSLGAVTMSRNISISGRGPGAASSSGGLVSVGSNIFNGDINLTGPGSAARISASHGVTTINGTVQLGASADSLFYGNGNFIINGQVTGFDVAGDRFIKSGNLIGTTLWLTNDDNNFIQPLRVDSGTVRVSTPGALGANTGIQQMDSNGGFFEVLTDVQDWSGVNFRKRGNGGGITVGHAIGSTLVDRTITFGDLFLDSNSTFQIQGRSAGYNTVVTGSANGGTAVDWVNGNPTTLSNLSSGLFTINADIQRRSETTARTLAINGNGDTLLTGNVLQLGTGAVSLVKDSQGTLTIQGTASTATGTTTVSNGTLSVSSFGALPSGALLIGNATTTPGAVTYTGAGETVNKAITFNTTTANVYLNADGSGALILTGAITGFVGVGGNKTFVLGGSSTAVNEIQSVITNNTGAFNNSLQKIGTGTWVLSGANVYGGTTTISNGVLQLKDTFSGTSRDVISSTGAVIFNTDTFTQSAGGTLEYLGDGANASTEALGALTITTGANTVKATAGSGGTADLTFASLGAPANGTGVNFVTNVGGSITLTGAADVNGILDAHLFYNGADFASGSAVTAAAYTVESAGVILAGANTTPYHVSTTDITGQTSATINAGIKFSDTRSLTLADAQTLTIRNGAAGTDGGILVAGGTLGTPVSVTISGGSGITSGGAGELVFRTDGAFDTLHLNTPVTAASTGGWTKLGAGTLVLGAANANTTGGFVHINEGTVQLQTGSTLGADSVDVNLRQGATLDLNGVNLGTVASGTGSLGTFNGAGTLTNTGAQASLRIGNDGSNSFFTGNISGAIDLVKNGNGTVWLSGPQSYTGVVTLSAGNLDVTSLANIGQASGLGTGNAASDAANAAALVFNGGALRYIGQNAANTYQSTQTPSVSIDRLFTLAGSGTIASFGSYGDNDSGTRVANHAALVFNNTAEVAFSGAGARTLTLRGDSLGDNYVGLQLIDNPNAGEALGVTKTDSGLWILGNAGNSYSGSTLIQAGVLQAEGNALSPNSNLFLDGGGALFQSSGTFTRAVGTAAGEVRFRTDGAREGFAASTAPLTVTLGTSGLIWGSANSPTAGTADFLGAGTLYLSSTTALADVDFTNDFEVTAGIAKGVTVSTTNASTTVTLTTGDTSGMAVGQAISGTNIPVGAYISSINAGNQISISVNATATGAGIAASVSGDGFREIRVDDNTLTGLDFATASGVISGAGGLGKEGTGLLILGDANTYSGKTVIRDGLLTVTSVGAAGDTSSSLGTNVGGGALEIGRPGSTSTANLLYVGSGETATRQIDLVGTTGTRRIDSSGSGALILANLNNSTAGSVNTAGGAKTLELRGQNTDGNMITSVLANNGGALTISKADGGVWILAPGSGPNTFTGTITAGGGSLGLTTNGIGSASQLNLSNGSIFGYGGDLAINTLVQLNNNTTDVFAGSNNITINANVQKQAGANDQTISNNLENGAVLTVNGNFVNLQTAAATRTISIRGYGDTVWNGIIQNNSGTSLTAWNIAIAPTASFTMTGGSANTYSGATTLTDGILILDKVGALGTGTFAFNGGTLRVGASPANLTGANAITNAVQINASPPRVDGTKSIEFSGIVALNGSRTLENALTGGAQLIISNGITNSAASTLTITGSGDTLISGNYNAGSGASGLALNGPGSLSLTGTSAATGTLSANNGTTTLSGTSGGSWNAGNVALNGNGILTLDSSGGNNGAGRIRDAGTVTMNGGVLHQISDGTSTAEVTGALTVNGIMGTIHLSGAGDNELTFASVNFPNSGSSLDLSGITDLGGSKKVIFSTAPTANIINGVLNRVMISGDFATHTANGVEAFALYNGGNNLNTAADADTLSLTANAGLGISRTLNALKIDGSGLDIGAGSATGAALALAANSVLNTGGNNTLSIPLVNIAGAGLFQVDPGTTLTVSSTLIGGGQINKVGTGELIINSRSFQASTFNLSGGLVTLNGGDNSLLFPGAGQLTLDTGATVDLNGNLQYVGVLAGSAGFPGAGGTIENTGALTTLVTNGGGTFGGVVQDDVNLGRIGGGTLTLEVAQTYTGGTALLGGDTTLRDNAALPLTSAPIEINQARLLLRNNDNLQTQIDDRVSDTAPITLRGGTIDVQGRLSTAATENMGALTVLEGANTITSTTGGGTITSATLTFASLNRSPGATINFTGSSALGAIGNLPKILFTAPLSTVGTGALGAWAIANSTDYAGYNAANGVGVAGTGGFVGYTPDFGSNNITNLDAAGRFGAARNLAAGTTATGMLRLGGKTINDLTFTGGTNVLNLELGGLLRENGAFSSSVGTPAARGVLTAGGAEVGGTRELVIYANTTGNLSFGGTSTTIGVGATQVTLATIGGLGLAVGMQVSNANFPAGTTITAIDNYNVLTLSNPSTNGTSQTNQTFTTGVINLGAQTLGSNVVTMATTVGLAPGMTITGTGIPVGTFVTSVDSGTQLTLSQAATTTVAGTAAYTLGMTNVIVNSVIADNGFGNSVALVKSGAGVLNLSAANTYSGGTYVDQGTLNLIGSPFTTVIPAGGLTITGGAVVLMNTNEGQIAPANTVNINGSGTLTMVGNNTLNGIVFDNNGGTGAPTVNVGGTLTLTSSTAITSTSKNAGTTPIVAGGTVVLPTGVNTFSVGAPALFGDVYTDKRAGLEISSKLTGSGVSLVKSGDGLLELSSSTSDFTGGISVTAGGIVLGNNSSGTVANILVSGPLGRGDVTMAAGTVVAVDDTSRTVANAFTWTSTTVNPIFDNTGISTDTMTLNGNLTFGTLATSGLVANVSSPYLNVSLGGAITGIGAVTAIGSGSGANTINKTGPGNIIGLNLTGISNTATINLEALTNLNTFSLLHDGDGTSSVETINLGTVTFEPVNGANLSLTIGRAGAGYYFPTAAYKTISLAGLNSSLLPNGLTLTNGNNYGLSIDNDIALATVSANTGPTFSVSAANTSLLPSGLTLAGQLTGGPAASGDRVLIKAGAGTLVLGDAMNTFGGAGAIIDITDGLIEAAGDGALGDSGNIVRISANNLAEGLRAAGTFATSREINLNAAGSGIDVTGSNVFTLNSAFTFAAATNALRKNDLGTLVLTQAQTIVGGAAADWDGVLTIGQGVLRITDGAALGSTTGNLILNNVGASLELPGGVIVADDIRIASTNNSSSNGINSSGAVHSTGGTNTITGAITIDTTTSDSQSRSGTLTADLGSTLNVTGGITLGLGTAGGNRDNWVGFGGEGTINLTTIGITHTGANGIGTLTKFGSGTLNIQVTGAFDAQQVVVKSGTLSLNGAGAFGASTISAPGTVYLNPTGVLVLDNLSTPVDHRLGGRNINISGADLTILGNSAAAVSETVGTFTLREGTSYFTLDADAAQQLNFTTGAVTRSAQSTLIVRGDNLGDVAAAGVATIKGGAYAFIGQLGGTGTTNKSILPWAYGDTSLSGEGAFFLTADSAASAANTGTNILRPLTISEQTTDLATALANVSLTTNETLSSLTTFNSLRLDNGGGITLAYVPLTLDSGGLMALTGNAGITAFSGVSYLTTTSNRELDVHTVDDLTLAVPIAGTTGALTKSGPATLLLTAGNTTHGTVMVNDGTLKLDGGDQTVLPGRNFYVNEGGILDLNGTVQQVNILESRQSAVLARNDAHFGGGTVLNSAGTQATLAMAGSSSVFAGSIQGNVAVVRSNAANTTNDWNLYVDQTYTGPTLYNGGRVILNDTAALTATTSIEISNATLLVTASNNATEASNLTNRINDAATISLRGGMLQLRARAALYTTETLGAVTLGEGNSIIDFAEGATAVNQFDATITSLARAGGSRATVRFLNMDATPSDDMRLFINTLNGSSTATIGGGLTNDLIGGWATFEREFASYIPGQGVGGLNTQGFAGYSPNILDEGIATDNIRIVLPNAGSTTLLTGNRTVNSLNMQAPTTSTDDSTLDLGGFTLTLAGGGLLLSPISTTAAANNIAVLNGNLTAGTTASPADLYLHAQSWLNGQADTTGNADVRISANIVDNSAGGSVTLVIDASVGKGTLVATNDLFLNGLNTYTGGTFVNAGQVRLNNASANGTTIFAVPGDLTITGGYSSNAGSLFNDRTSTVILNFDSQINNTATVTIMGGGILNLNNNNQTIADLIFNNHGGTVPQVTTGIGTLTLTGNSITADGQNVSSNAVSTIDGKLALVAATTTITVNPVQWNGENLNPILPNLIINASIEGTDIVKAGIGVLRLNGSNAWTGAIALQAGGILLGSNNALSGGTLTIGDNTFLSSTADNRIIANDFTVSGNFALKDAFNLTMSGAGTLAAGNHDISVELTLKTLTLSGALGGASAHINKTGDGILVLSNNSNAYGGTTTVSDGILRYGAVDAVPAGSALTVQQGALLDITLGGSAVTVGSLASNSATTGGVIVTTATSGTTTFTAGANNTSTDFGGVLVSTSGATLNFVKTGTGTLTLGGWNQYNGSTTVEDGRLVAKSVGGNSPLGTSQSLILGGTTTSGILQLGDGAAPLDLTFTSLVGQGTGTLNKFVGGNTANSTLTVDVAGGATLFFGNIGGAGANEANLNFVKQGAGDLSFAGTGTSTFNGTTTVGAGKLFMNTPGAFSATTTSLSVADGAEFTLRGNTGNTVTSYGFSGAGAKIVVGSATGGTLGFGVDGAVGVNQLVLAAGQTMQVPFGANTFTTAIYVNGAPVSGNQYVLIDGADAGSLSAFSGTGAFNVNPVVFNGGSFTYALAFTSGVHGGGLEQWTLTPTAVPSQPDTWWKGDLTGLAQGVWSATIVAGTGAPSNWDAAVASGVDAVVPPDDQSNVHFSATGAANFATTLGASMTIKTLTFHTGNAATTIGSSNGVNTLTLGNGVDTPFLTLETGVGNVGLSVVVALPQDQSWNIEDVGNTLTLSGGLTGTSRTLNVNDDGFALGTLLFSGSAAMTGTLNQNAGTLAFEDTGSLNTGVDVVLGTIATSATLKVGNTVAATGAVIGGLSNGALAGSKVVGGNATTSTLTLGAASGSHTFTGALGGGGANENNFHLVKAGAGTQILNGATITYSGTTTVREGTLQLGSAAVFAPTGALAVIADAGTTATMDFNGKSYTGTGILTLGGGVNGIAQILDTNGTPGTLTLGGNIVYDAANDPGGAILGAKIATGGARTVSVGSSVNAVDDLTFNGTVAATGSMTIDGAGDGVINGAWTLTGTNLAIVFSSTGTWDINAVTNTTGSGDWNINSGTINATVSNALNASDNIIIDGTGVQGSAVVNIGGTAGTSGVHQGNDLYIRNGGLVNVVVNNGISTGTDQILVGDTASASAAAAAVLNLSANISVGANGILVGNGTNIGNVTGTGTITTAGGKDLRNGSIEAGITLAGNGAILKQTTGTVVFAGERSAASTGATGVREGELILDYTTNNNSKIGGVLSLGLAGVLTDATLTLNGNAAAATTQSVASTTVLPGNMNVALNHGAGQTLALNLGALARSVPGGTVFFQYSSADAQATSTSPAGTLSWATVKTGTGVERFAAIDGSGKIVQATFTTQNNPSLWAAGQDVIVDDATTGLAGDCTTISSLTFTSSVASTVTVTAGQRLAITSGGILVGTGLGAVDMRILGGELVGATSGVLGEIIVHQNNGLGTLTIGSNIVRSGGITKTGAGTLILSGSNSFLAVGSQLNINEGAVQLSGGNALGDNTNVYLRSGTTLNLANSNEAVGSFLDESGGTVALGTGDLTIHQSLNADFRGVFTGGAGSLITLNAASGTTTFNLNVTGATAAGFTGTVVVNAGLLQFSAGGRLANATAFTINRGGNLLLDNNGSTRSGDRILNTATITLNSADGVANGQTQPRGLWLRADQDGTLDETVGVVTANSGASYVTLEATTTNDDSDVVMTNLVRANSATLNVRGTNLGSVLAQNNQFRIGNGTNETAFIAALVGGDGAAASKTISIVPWAVGETYTGATSTTVNMGNSLVTYVSGVGIRPLDFTTEYSTFAGAGGATDNVRENLTANLIGLTTQTVNALVINKNSTGAGTISVSGTNTGGQILTNTSGAFLFTLIPTATASTAHTIVVDGFDGGIQVGASNEYVIHVVNPSSAATTALLTTRIDSVLNTAGASLTKAGRGTLELNAVNTYGGGTTINEGALQIHANGNLGAGGLTLAGGTLQLAADYVDDLGDLSVLTVSALAGGGAIDTNGITVTATDLTIAGTGTLAKTGLGTLQLAGTSAATFTGLTVVNDGVLELNVTGANALGSGGVSLIALADLTTVRLLQSHQIHDAAPIVVESTGSNGAVFTLNGHSDTVGSVTITGVTTNGTVLQTGSGGILTVTGDIIFHGNRNATGNNGREVLITGTGTRGTAAVDSGTLDLGGVPRTIVVQSNNTQLNSDATIETIVTNGGIVKEGTRTLYLSGTNTYSGMTTINEGAISISAAANLGDGSATNTVALNYGGVLQSTGADFDLGANRSLALGGDGGTLEVTGANLLTVSGIISGDDCAELFKTGSGTLALGGANTYQAVTNVLAGTLQVGNVALNGGTTGTLGTGAVLVSAGALLSFNRTDTLNVSNAVSGDGAVIQSELGTTILAGVNTYAGTTTVAAGILQFAERQALYNAVSTSWNATNLIVQAGATAAFNVGGGGEFDADDITLLNNQGTGSGGFMSGSFLGLDTTNAGGTFTYGSVLDDAGFSAANSRGLVKLGSGTLELTQINTYTGRTLLHGGTLAIAGEANLGADPLSPAADHLTFRGGTLATTTSFAIDDGNRGITVSGPGGAIDTATGTKLEYANLLAGDGTTFTKSGEGSFTLTNAGGHSFSGAINVAAGTFNVAEGASLGGGVNVSGGTFSPGANTINGDQNNGVGSLTTSSATDATWSTGSNFVFDFAVTDTDTGAPTGTNWDYLRLTGAGGLVLASGAAYTVSIRSWLGADYGDNGFDPDAAPDIDLSTKETSDYNASYRWLWVDNLGGGKLTADNIDSLTGNSTGALTQFVVDTSSFYADGGYTPTPGAHFWVSAYQNDLYINYSAVPEPGSLLLVGLAGLGFAGYRRRKRRALDATETEADVTSSLVDPEIAD